MRLEYVSRTWSARESRSTSSTAAATIRSAFGRVAAPEAATARIAPTIGRTIAAARREPPTSGRIAHWLNKVNTGRSMPTAYDAVVEPASNKLRGDEVHRLSCPLE